MRLQLTERQERNFWAKVNKTDTCWLWTAYLNDTGYGQFRVGALMPPAHRVSYAIAVKIPNKVFVINHLCYVRNCVNPDHLEAVTQYENLMYSDSPVKINKLKTLCKRGHELAGDNLRFKKNKYGTKRICVECRRRQNRIDRTRRKERLQNVEA